MEKEEEYVDVLYVKSKKEKLGKKSVLKQLDQFFNKFNFVFEAIEAVLVILLRIECIISPLVVLKNVHHVRLSRFE